MTTLLAADDPTWPAAAGSAPATADLHLHPDLAPAHLPQEPSIGVLSVAGAWRPGAVAAGMLAGYLASRTVGLPPGHHQGWADPHGVACLLLEAASLAAYLAALATSSP